jgi:hypothetical protein
MNAFSERQEKRLSVNLLLGIVPLLWLKKNYFPLSLRYLENCIKGYNQKKIGSGQKKYIA